MAFWETIFYWVALVAYSLAAGGCIYSFVFKNPRVMPKITLLVAGGFIAATLPAQSIGTLFARSGRGWNGCAGIRPSTSGFGTPNPTFPDWRLGSAITLYDSLNLRR